MFSISAAARTSYLSSGTSSVFDFLESQVDNYAEQLNNLSRNPIISASPDFNFSDLNAKIIIDPNENTHLDVNFFYSVDDFKNGYSIDYLSRNRFIESLNKEVFRQTESWSNMGWSTNFKREFIQGWNLHATLHYTDHDNSGGIESLLNRNIKGEQLAFRFNNFQNNIIIDFGGVTYLEKKLPKGSLKIGTAVKKVSTKFELKEDESSLVDLAQEANEYAGFASYEWTTDQWNVLLGARTTRYTNTEGFYLDPQIRLSFQLNDNWQWKGSLSLMHQYVRDLTYENRLGQTNSYLTMADEALFPVGASTNVMLGWTLKKNEWTFDVEFYNRKMDGVIEYAFAKARIPRSN